MGFRFKIGVMDRSRYEEIKDIQDWDDLNEWAKSNLDYTYFALYVVTKEVFELGKYYDCDFLGRDLKPIFSNKKLHKEINDDQLFMRLTKKGFEKIIDDQRQMILTYYESLALEKDISDIDKALGKKTSIEHHISAKIKAWGENAVKYKLPPYNMSLKDESVVSSWEYEYTIFDLVRVYKSIDWNNQIVTLNGW